MGCSACKGGGLCRRRGGDLQPAEPILPQRADPPACRPKRDAAGSKTDAAAGALALELDLLERQGPADPVPGQCGKLEEVEEDSPSTAPPTPTECHGAGNTSPCFNWCGAGGLGGLLQFPGRKVSRRPFNDDGTAVLKPLEKPRLEEAQLDPLEAAATELRSCGAGALPCRRGCEGLAVEGRERALQAAEVLRRYPQVGALILGHTNPPSHDMSAVDLEELAYARAEHVRGLLRDAGCTNALGVRGVGHKEGKDATCEVVACRAFEVTEAETLASRASLHFRHWRASAELTVTFARSGGLSRTVTFTRRPLGLVLSHSTPTAVNAVDPGSSAEKLGVEVGWLLQAVDGEDFSQKEYQDAMAQLGKRARALPRASVC